MRAQLNLAAIPVLLLIGVPLAAAQQETTLRFKFRKGDELNYHVVSKIRLVQMLLGKEVEMDFLVDQEVNWVVREIEDNGTARLTVKFPRCKMAMTAPGGKFDVDSKDTAVSDNPTLKNIQILIRTMANVEFTALIAVNGEIRDVKATSDALRKIKTLPGMEMMSGFFSEESIGKSLLGGLVLPSGPVTKGKQWTQKSESKNPLGTMINTFQFEYQGSQNKNRKNVEVLTMIPDMEIKTDPGSKLDIKTKVVEARGYAYFDADAGRLRELSNNIRLELTIHMGNVSLVQQMSTATSIELK